MKLGPLISYCMAYLLAEEMFNQINILNFVLFFLKNIADVPVIHSFRPKYEL